MAFRNPPEYLVIIFIAATLLGVLLPGFEALRELPKDADLWEGFSAFVIPVVFTLVVICAFLGIGFLVIHMNTTLRSGDKVLITGGEFEGERGVVAKSGHKKSVQSVRIRLDENGLVTLIPEYHLKKVS